MGSGRHGFEMFNGASDSSVNMLRFDEERPEPLNCASTLQAVSYLRLMLMCSSGCLSHNLIDSRASHDKRSAGRCAPAGMHSSGRFGAIERGASREARQFVMRLQLMNCVALLRR